MSNKDYLDKALKIAKQSTCSSEPKGAVIVNFGRIIATGFNNVPHYGVSCKEKFGCCYRRSLGHSSGERLDLCRGIHAEAAAVCEAAKLGYSTEGSTIFTSHLPCNECAKLIVNSGIIKVVYAHEYSSTSSREILLDGNVVIEYLPLDCSGQREYSP